MDPARNIPAGRSATGPAIFELAERRLAWIGRRQELLAQNIANADTPGWKSRDLKPFAAVLAGQGGVAPTRTNTHHLAGVHGPLKGEKERGERAPDGNAVALDVELSRVADTESAHALVTSLYSKYLAMFRTASGR